MVRGKWANFLFPQMEWIEVEARGPRTLVGRHPECYPFEVINGHPVANQL